MAQTQVLVAGAGPTGLVLALWLTKLGVCRADRRPDRPSPEQRRGRWPCRPARWSSTARSASPMRWSSAATRCPASISGCAAEHAARVGFEVIGEALTPYPFLLIFPQDEHERLLIERLADAGVAVERRTELVGFSDEGDRIVAQAARAGRRRSTCEAAYLAGCDGARSTVREGDRRRLSRRHLPAAVLRRRRRGGRPGDGRRAARRSRRGRLPGGLSAGRRGPRPADRHGARRARRPRRRR